MLEDVEASLQFGCSCYTDLVLIVCFNLSIQQVNKTIKWDKHSGLSLVGN